MRRHGAIDLDFGDGTFTFRLGLTEIEELEEKRGASLFTITRRLDPAVREPWLADVINVIRLGLIGGGMTAVDALVKVRRYVDERPLDESRDVAFAVVLAALARVHSDHVEDDMPGEAEAPKSSDSTSAPSAPQP
jgi:hypothetical protein